MQELFESALREVTNGSLSNAILEVHIYPAKGELLALGLACLTEEAVCELPIVIVVVGDTNAMLSSKVLKHSLGVDGLFASQIACHQTDKLEARIMVHKNSRVAVARLGE